jgi:hypothetical protein
MKVEGSKRVKDDSKIDEVDRKNIYTDNILIVEEKKGVWPGIYMRM